MKRIVLSILLFGYFSAQAQVQPSGLPTRFNNSWYDFTQYLSVGKGFFHPLLDTTWTPYRVGALTIRPQDSLFYKWSGTKWEKFGVGVTYTAGYGMQLVGNQFRIDSLLLASKLNVSDSLTKYVTPKQLRDSLGNATFKNNIVLNGGSGNRLGYWLDGDTIPVAGKTLDEAFLTITQRAVPPTYLPPLANISASVTPNTYEFGSNLGTITLSSTYTQRNGGADTLTRYFQNGSPIGGNSAVVSSLTSNQSFYVGISYRQGACINNNLGVLDCTGRINAGTVNSSSISYNVGYRRYFGFISDTTGILTGGQNAAILALANLSQFSTSKAITVNTGNPSGSGYWVFGYLSTSGTITSLTKNGFNAIDAYNTGVISNFVNAQGATISLRVYYDKVIQTTASDIITN